MHVGANRLDGRALPRIEAGGQQAGHAISSAPNAEDVVSGARHPSPARTLSQHGALYSN
jgi:hypothetical protein